LYTTQDEVRPNTPREFDNSESDDELTDSDNNVSTEDLQDAGDLDGDAGNVVAAAADATEGADDADDAYDAYDAYGHDDAGGGPGRGSDSAGDAGMGAGDRAGFDAATEADGPVAGVLAAAKAANGEDTATEYDG
jgi:hypothetical protein